MSPRMKMAEAPSVDSINVKLKPVFGISPRTYLPIIWGILLLAIIFLLLILPGIRRNGTLLTVFSLPSDAAVLVDDTYLGTAGDALFVPKGHRTLSVKRPGFQPFVQKIDLKGRIFASRIFPRRASIVVRLHPEPDIDLFRIGFTEFAAWAATGPSRERYAIPPTLTRAARDTLQTDISVDANIVLAALPLALDERHLADILRARFLLQFDGSPVGISTLGNFIQDVYRQLDAKPEVLRGISSLINSDRFSNLGIDTKTLMGDTREFQQLAESIYASSRVRSEIRTFGKESFIVIPALSAPVGDLEVVSNGYLPRAGAHPSIASVDEYLIGMREVTQKQYLEFVQYNPRWLPENRENLSSSNLVDDGYLTDWSGPNPALGFEDNPVVNVSWHAASAYCDWFTRQYLGGTGLWAQLPTEDQWEIAGRLNHSASDIADTSLSLKSAALADRGILRILGMAGNVREWCGNPFRYNENLFRSSEGHFFHSEGDKTLEAPKKSVRGGAYIDDSLPYPLAVRGGLFPEQTSPVIGFRLVLLNEKP